MSETHHYILSFFFFLLLLLLLLLLLFLLLLLLLLMNQFSREEHLVPSIDCAVPSDDWHVHQSYAWLPGDACGQKDTSPGVAAPN